MTLFKPCACSLLGLPLTCLELFKTPGYHANTLHIHHNARVLEMGILSHLHVSLCFETGFEHNRFLINFLPLGRRSMSWTSGLQSAH
jgi:hypothetical protein